MVRRHIINAADAVIPEALEGLALAHPDLVHYNAEYGFIRRARRARDKVGLVSGGGSGHEPLHTGFVGVGMLDVAVAGAVFASPTALQVHEGTLAADSGRGVLQIVKNYTGDVLNFTIAGELAGDREVETEMVLVDDDLATDAGSAASGSHVADTTDADGPGRRGTAATVVVEKAAGARAEQGGTLREVTTVARRVARHSRTMSLALAAGTHPGADRPQFDLGSDEIELGVGIHGERGVARAAFAPADELAASLVEPLVADLGLRRGAGVLAVINGLGGETPIELSIVARAVHLILAGLGITVRRNLVGDYVTSLDMHGFSVTLTPADDDLIALWDAPVRTPALTW
ncbi:dihydroxyacetone kinase subunit DhaK [Tsukamurella soli]|uniref:Dihydroxyacetone kinase subunit DhaK n=1 Tax=Tsukamurella soli TaxID=644556 RepID=A0ABP8K973_9ACTN